MPIDVFISYRGADRVLARRLEQRLRSRWGSCVFRDETSLMAGRGWADQLEHAMTNAEVMLALVGKGWHVRDEGEDWVRDELLGAVKAGHPVLPVIVGDPDELAKRLTTLPKAFTNQAVVVSEDLAGFDMHKIEKALRDLGAFSDQEGQGQQLAEIVPETAERRARDALDAGRSVVVTGASGSGRTPLLRRLVSGLLLHAERSAPTEPDGDDRLHLVAACGIDHGERNRRTHRVVAAWIDGLCAAITDLSVEQREWYGPRLVASVVDIGPDLLTRGVLRPESLLPLGDDESDQQILDAVRRPADRSAPFSPERLVSQAIGVLLRFARSCDAVLTLVVDHVDSLDDSSRTLVRRLVEADDDHVRLVLATSAVQPQLDPDEAAATIVRALGCDADDLADFESISLHDQQTWGAQGAVVKTWLQRHRVRLADELLDWVDDPNPYYALSALWYLVDNGYLVQEDGSTDHAIGDTGGSGSADDHVVWVPSPTAGERIPPTRDQLLDHKINEYIPIRFRDVISVGALMGRRFPFAAAYAASYPPKSSDGEAPTPAAIARWRNEAAAAWTDLRTVDPDRSVITCHTSVDGERMIELAQVDLVAHFVARLGRTVDATHARLARYFDDPLDTDVGQSLDDRYTRAKSAAHHWTRAGEPRHAADAERVAAGLAEQALAYGEARDHYRRGIRLLTQLLAKNSRNRTLQIEDHQDLLVLANCLYRLGQMTRLASERESVTGERTDPTRYLRHALERLEELSANLHDRRLAAPESAGPVALSARDLPQPNIIRHHIRLCASLSGWITLELAEWYELCGETAQSRALLFDTLRHAEAARGEADSRWLLTAASARLAHQLITDATEVHLSDPARARNLTMEAHYQIERVINLQAVSPDEERNLESPRARAWMALGRIFQSTLVEPDLAEWAYRRMNEHRRDVHEIVDMTTDRQLGLFLLSRSRCGGGPEHDDADRAEARGLLERHARWARESGLGREHAAAALSLAVLALVEHAGCDDVDLTVAHRRIDEALSSATDPLLIENAHLLRGALHAVEHGTATAAAFGHDDVVAAFRAAFRTDGTSTDESTHEPTVESADEVLRRGWTTALVRLLRICPDLRGPLGPAAIAPPDRSDAVDDIVHDVRLGQAFEMADQYLGRIDERGRSVPSNDQNIWKLLEQRIPEDCFERARRTRQLAIDLVQINTAEFDDVGVDVVERDVAYAIALQEWYRSTDPSRLLTLARESNMLVDGAEWASPRLLIGRIALRVLAHQYDSAEELGAERFDRIERLLTNWASTSTDAGTLERIYFVAMQSSEPAPADSTWRATALEPNGLSEAYRLATAEREVMIRQAGLPLLQDLDPMDDVHAAAQTRPSSVAGAHPG